MDQKALDPAPNTWPGRREAAQRLGVDERTLRRWETKGRLRARRDEEGTCRYDPAEVDDLAREHGGETLEQEPNPNSGEIAAKVFALLNQGKDPREVVVELRLPPTHVQALYAEWLVMGRSLLVTYDERCRLARSIGNHANVAELIASVEHLKELADLARRFVFPCAECGEPVQATHAHWRAIVNGGAIRHWPHDACQRVDAE